MPELPEGIVDDDSVPNNTRLLRRVPKFLVRDGVVESSAFDERDPNDGLSVTAWEHPENLDEVLAGHEGFAVICVTAEQVRALGAVIVRCPLPDNPTHCEIYPRLSGGKRRQLKNLLKWVYYPDWVAEEHRVQVEKFNGC